jgi:hypothetical protein
MFMSVKKIKRLLRRLFLRQSAIKIIKREKSMTVLERQLIKQFEDLKREIKDLKEVVDKKLVKKTATKKSEVKDE